MAVFSTLVKAVILLRLLNLRLRNILLVSGPVDLGIADAGLSAHFGGRCDEIEKFWKGIRY
jgi:hypothetical protein